MGIGTVFPWVIGQAPPEVIKAGPATYAVWFSHRSAAFIVFPAERRNGPVPPAQLEQQLQRAAAMAPPDCIIGGHRVVAVGPAWKRQDLIAHLRSLLESPGGHLAMVPASGGGVLGRLRQFFTPARAGLAGALGGAALAAVIILLL